VPGKKEKLPLSVTHPELAKQAVGWDPSGVFRGSKQRMKWLCHEGHLWEQEVRRRTEGSGKCPTCSKLPIKGLNDLASQYPSLAAEAFGWNPAECKPFSNKKREWRCLNNHIWICSPAKRITDGTDCTLCSGFNLIPGQNDLATTNPDIAKMAIDWNPSDFKAGSNARKEWLGLCGHTFTARIADVSGGTKCPYCAGKKILIGFNDLETTHPEIAKDADGWNPAEYSAGSHLKVTWKCRLEHRWSAPIKSRTLQNSGCPSCSGRRVLSGFNDLKTLNPEIAEQAFGWDPTTVTVASNRTLEWKCRKGHIWNASVASRTVGGRKSEGYGCPYCSGKRVAVGFNDLQTRFPLIASEADGWDPEKITGGSKRKLNWKCNKGHSWIAAVVDRTGVNSSGCPYCSNQKVLQGFNDLATTHPELSTELVSEDPTKIIAGTNRKVKWKCPEGHQWSATVHSRSNSKAGRGCPTCAITGFDPNKDGYLYFLEHPSWIMYQIGITNVPDKRLASHGRLGWNLIQLRGPSEGHLTQQWETAILRMLKAKGADLSNDKIAGKFDGYSEAWSKSKFEASSITELMEMVEKWETNGK
jgi:hypothetical protein